MRLEDRATTTYYISLRPSDGEYGGVARWAAGVLAGRDINATVAQTYGTWEGKIEDGAMIRSQEDIPTVLKALAIGKRLRWVHMEIQQGGTPEFDVSYVDLDRWRS